jgi:NAD(P)-dependent dehydrogenase (short-subunit alcohol dehydrogenase family)
VTGSAAEDAGPTFALVGTSAIVTGAARGIGYEIAGHLMAAGASVLIYDIDGEGADRSARSLAEERPEGRAVAFVGDVADEEAQRAAFDLATAEMGPPKILVNNAGINDLRPLVRLSADEWRRLFDVIALGTFLGTREFGRRFMEQELTGGAVVNISSLNYAIPTRGYPHYCAAKAGVSQFTRCAALELAPLGIRVNAIAPGLTNTPLAGSFFEENPEVPQAFVDLTPLGRVGETADIARVAVFLASRASGWVTGHTLPVDGGANLLGLPDSWSLMGAGLGLPEPTAEEWQR